MSKPHYTGHRARLRKRLLDSRSGSLPDYEILEVILFAGNLRSDTKPLAKQLISQFGSLADVLTAKAEDLLLINGMNDTQVANIRAVQEAGIRLAKSKINDVPIFNNGQAVIDYCMSTIGHKQTEHFCVLYLDSKNQLLADDVHDHGTVNKISIFPREIVRRALSLHASSIILAHNHPSGDPTPSSADITLTKAIKAACQLLDITLHDHVIVSPVNAISMQACLQ
tara:strand:- start:65 stop:739 length:675 start_codon:yes stop_codon:yes gene_type:complete